MSFFETPAEAGKRLDALSDAWNTFRNAIIGRGTALPPGIPQSFANRVATEWAGWRAFYEDARDDWVASLTGGFEEDLTRWQQRYNALYAEADRLKLARSRGVPAPSQLPQPPGLPPVVVEHKVPPIEAPGVKGLGTAIVVGAVVLAGAALVVTFALRRRA